MPEARYAEGFSSAAARGMGKKRMNQLVSLGEMERNEGHQHSKIIFFPRGYCAGFAMNIIYVPSRFQTSLLRANEWCMNE